MEQPTGGPVTLDLPVLEDADLFRIIGDQVATIERMRRVVERLYQENLALHAAIRDATQRPPVALDGPGDPPT